MSHNLEARRTPGCLALAGGVGVRLQATALHQLDLPPSSGDHADRLEFPEDAVDGLAAEGERRAASLCVRTTVFERCSSASRRMNWTVRSSAERPLSSSSRSVQARHFETRRRKRKQIAGCVSIKAWIVSVDSRSMLVVVRAAALYGYRGS